jgi:phosphatidylinositol-bisphosphatase
MQEVVKLTGKAVWNADETNSQLWQRQILDLIGANKKYVILRSYQLVGILLTVFVREEQAMLFRDVHSEIAKVGFGGIAGNKGAISIRFNFHQTSFCFTCAHLAAGQNNVEERDRDYNDIITNTSFRTGKGTVTIFDHE